MSNIFNKYSVAKNGSPTDPNAQYFVLRIDTDPAARYALHAYAGYIARSDPLFSRELLAWVAQYESASNTFVQRTWGAVAQNDELPDEKMCATCDHSESRHNTAGGFCKHCTCNKFADSVSTPSR